jgi:hypothetical protein
LAHKVVITNLKEPAKAGFFISGVNPMKQLLQLMIEEKYSAKTLRKDIHNALYGRIDISKHIEALDSYRGKEYYESKNKRIRQIHMDNESLVYSAIVAVYINKGEEQPIQAVVSRLYPVLDMLEEIDAIKTAAEIVGVLVMSDLFDLTMKANEYYVSGNLTLPPSLSRRIDSVKYLPPMMCKPNKVMTSRDTSHLTFVDHVILGRMNHHNKPVPVDVLNIANSVELELDEDILQFEESPNKELDTPDKVSQFQQMASESVDVYNEILENGNSFYFTWKYDFRGRMYSQGYHVNIQATDYKKALISLKNKRIIK